MIYLRAYLYLVLVIGLDSWTANRRAKDIADHAAYNYAQKRLEQVSKIRY